MSVSARIICRTCKEQLWLGKWLRNVEGRGFGFWVNQVDYEVLGLKALNFLARHADHHVQILTDQEFDRLSRSEPLYEYLDVFDATRSDWPKDAEPG